MNAQSLPRKTPTWMHRARILAPGLLVLLLASGVCAGPPPELTSEQEATAREVEEQLMAPCCFGGTVATHHSPTADAIRRQVRIMAAQGASAQQILDKYLEVYGERILAQPVARGFNLLAYWMPAAGMLLGTAVVLLWLRRRGRDAASAPGVAPAAGETDDDAMWQARRQLARELASFDG